MSTETPPKISDAEYPKWAQNLVGKDWEIFWQEEEDGNEDESDTPDDLGTDHPITATTTASGQETAEKEMADKNRDGNADEEMKVDGVGVQVGDLSSDKTLSTGDGNETEKFNESQEFSKTEEKEGTGEKDDVSEGSVIDDWYDGHVVGILSDTTGPIASNGWKFRVNFLGDEDTYEVFLMPDKVRPSARGWLQRTIALLNPPITAAGEDSNKEESQLPPDTSTLDDEQNLQVMRAKIIDTTNIFDSLSQETENRNHKTELPSLPAYDDFRRIQTLWFQLESQIYLRQKLSKIENHSGKELFTDGVRNPTENYVNFLVQCCKDLVQACSWYCKSWKLLLYYFGNKPTVIGGIDGINSMNTGFEMNTGNGIEEVPCQQIDLGKLTFEELIRGYLEFGKNSMVNAAMIDVNASGHSNKRRQIITQAEPSSNRRTKRRRKISRDTAAGLEEEIDEKNASLLTAASKLDTEILSREHVDSFISTIMENVCYEHIATLGHMLQSLSHLVVQPLASWKSQARRILGIKNEGSDPYNLMIDRVGADAINDAKDPSSDSEDEEREEFFSDKQIETCLSIIRNNSVLSRFNLFDDVHKLHAKLGDIQKNETKILALLNGMATDSTATISQETYYDRNKDKILSGLVAILDDIDSSESTLYNVDPLSTKTSTVFITRGNLLKVVELRTWFVDVQHAQSCRERYTYLQGLISKIKPSNTLPDPKDIPAPAGFLPIMEKRESLMQSIIGFREKIENCVALNEKRENDFLAASKAVDLSNFSDLKSHLTFLHSTLSESKDSPVIFPVEEKVAAAIDLIEWYHKVNNMLGRASVEGNKIVSFFDIKRVYEDLQSVLKGLSSTRSTLVHGVEFDSKTNDEICKFLSSDLFSTCEKSVSEVTTLYNASATWKNRAESIILCLRTYGNTNAGESITSSKQQAMVDIKRIVDLTEEYPGLQVEVPGYFEQLQRIQEGAYQWSQNLFTTLMDEQVSFTNALSFIKKERDQRPKGIIIYPTRTIADVTVDFLEWYENIKNAAKIAAGELNQQSKGKDLREVAAAYTNLIIREFYPILADGSETLEIYCGSYKASNMESGQFEAVSNQTLEILEKRFRIRKTSRAISREKINSSDLVSSLLSRMSSKDEKEGFPLQLILWFNWHLRVADFISGRENGDGEDSELRRDHIPSLQEAKQIKAQNPFLSSEISLSDAPNARSLVQTKSIELIELDRIIEDAQNAEISIKKHLGSAKELLRGPLLEKAERIRNHLSSLKMMLSILKARSVGEGGLSINETFENPLEQHIKYFTWLVRTLQYPVLHQGEASYTSSSKGEGTEPERIPWNSLVSIHERMPCEISEFGDPILCILRVKELYTAAKKWQDEVSRSTLISNRGNKRRGIKSPRIENSVQLETKEVEKDVKLGMRTMEMLAEDRILSKIDMPRHKAVKAMVDAKKKFEIELENFLAQDFDGNQDNTPLPKGDSLVGRNGQFILYRLTGSSLFSMMQTSVQSLAAIGDNVFAETRGKAAFDWMRSAVTWIEELQDAVVTQSKFINENEKVLVLPKEDAKQLCKSGENIFLQTNRDVTQTLSNHGIYASVNSIQKRLNVRLKKDGAHHSVGGIVIRWCPILFDALRSDVTKLESWESGLWKVAKDFNQFVATSSDSDDSADEEILFRWYGYYMSVQTSLEEGQNSLVISPSKDTIDSFTNLLSTIRNHLDENCSSALINGFSKRYFANSASLYEDRFKLLDALLYRREIARDVDDDTDDFPISFPETKGGFRDLCRSNLENALSRAASVLDLDSAGVSGIEDLCAIKAWEIETEMFEIFEGDASDCVSEDYRIKARSLKHNLENTSNLSLCLEVLTGVIKANTLVKMTSEQFASRKIKLERERARHASLKEKASNPGVEALLDKRTNQENHAKPLKSILKNRTVPLALQKDAASGTGAEKSKNSLNHGYLDFDKTADGAPTVDSEEESNEYNPISSGNSRKRQKKWSYETPRSPPPPPPPSLAASFDTNVVDGKGSSREPESRIRNSVGGDSFQIEIQGQAKYTFSAAFHHEDLSQRPVNQIMSETLVQKGRSKIDDFDRFVSEKLRGGRWQATCLRLTTIGDRDASIYKAFYKDFEAKERIAMFKLPGGSGGKLFMVTPKFHHIAKRNRDITFGNKNSTYAIVLTKRDSESWK